MRILSVASVLSLLITNSACAAEGHFNNRTTPSVVGVEVITPIEDPIYIETHSVYAGPNFLREITVKDALRAEDDEKVMLRGRIARQTAENHYVFKDETGEIPVKIKRKHMPHQKFDHNSIVQIYGEIDRSETSPKVEVNVKKTVKILSSTTR